MPGSPDTSQGKVLVVQATLAICFAPSALGSASVNLGAEKRLGVQNCTFTTRLDIPINPQYPLSGILPRPPSPPPNYSLSSLLCARSLGPK